MQKIILILFILIGTTAANAQAKKDSLPGNISDDTITIEDHFAEKNHFGFYASMGQTFPIGNPYLTDGGNEYGTAFSITSITYSADVSFSLGLEYQSKAKKRSFFIIDFGMAWYKYDATVQGELTSPGQPSPGPNGQTYYGYTTSMEIQSYQMDWMMAECAPGYLYGIVKTDKASVCAGAELHLSYLISTLAPVLPFYSSYVQNPPGAVCLSANVRCEGAVNEHTLFFIEGYFTYGAGNLLGHTGTPGVRMGFLF